VKKNAITGPPDPDEKRQLEITAEVIKEWFGWTVGMVRPPWPPGEPPAPYVIDDDDFDDCAGNVIEALQWRRETISDGDLLPPFLARRTPQEDPGQHEGSDQ
jgi:hypothetical protein